MLCKLGVFIENGFTIGSPILLGGYIIDYMEGWTPSSKEYYNPAPMPI